MKIRQINSKIILDLDSIVKLQLLIHFGLNNRVELIDYPQEPSVDN